MPLELKATINLPKTAFPMKANRPQNEPKMLERWEQMGIYNRIRQARKGAPRYILHDGPPYTSGPIHMGTALNKCLKDFIVKSKTMAGFDAPYVPGWDCHGLPIEIKVDKELGGKKLQMKASDVRAECRKYAQPFELRALQVEIHACVFAALFAHGERIHVELLAAQLVVNFDLDGQAVAVPSRHKGSVEAAHAA